jgi:hypothetical protein
MAAPEREMAQSTGARLHSPSRQLSDEDVFSDLCTQGYAILPSYLRGTRLAALQAAAGRALPCYKYAAEGSQAAEGVLPAANAVSLLHQGGGRISRSIY